MEISYEELKQKVTMMPYWLEGADNICKASKEPTQVEEVIVVNLWEDVVFAQPDLVV